jgi:hypothetical protein
MHSPSSSSKSSSTSHINEKYFNGSEGNRELIIFTFDTINSYCVFFDNNNNN